jgi:cytidine deaminase
VALTDSHIETCLASAEGPLRQQLSAAINADGFSGQLEDISLTHANALLALAAAFSVHPISGFAVGALAVGQSGRIYLGANMEFHGVPLHASLHAEQSALINAWMHDESEVVALHVSETPCGHCRQFLRELSNSEYLEIYVRGQRRRLGELLPYAFGEPRAKGAGLLDSRPVELEAARIAPDTSMQRAINAAQRSYAPYSRSPEGFTLECLDGRAFSGRAAESAAFNPSVPGVLAALNQRNLSSSRSVSITYAAQAKLVTAINNPLSFARALIHSVSKIKVDVVQMEML